MKIRGSSFIVIGLGLIATLGCGESGSGAGDRGDVGSRSISQWGVTWVFERPCEHGQYANGDYWVVGPARIIAITPDSVFDRHDDGSGICVDQWSASDCASHCSTAYGALYDGYCNGTTAGMGSCICERLHHGWEVNAKVLGGQPYDSRIRNTDGRGMPNLPYLAQPGESIIKSISREPLTDENCRSCLETAAVLTVVAAPPPDNGATVFRPPYVQFEKPEYRTTAIRAELLPHLAPVAAAPSLGEVKGWFERVQMDHVPGRTSTMMRPNSNLPNYGADVAVRTNDGALRLMLDDDLDNKMPALVAYLQGGLDRFYFMKNGMTWQPGGGEQPGEKISIVFFAALLGDQAAQDLAGRTTIYEDYMINPGRDGTIYFGESTLMNPWATERNYWQAAAQISGSKTIMDPYGLIDGGEIPGDSYQACCTSLPFKGTALALRLMPALWEIWPHVDLVRYAERWVNKGAITQPDECAPLDGQCVGGNNPGQACTFANESTVCTGTDAHCDATVYWDPDNTLDKTNHYGVTYGPDPNRPGRCIADTDPSDGMGRFPLRHGSSQDDGYRGSAFQSAMWTSYYSAASLPTVSCGDGFCDAVEGYTACPADCPCGNGACDRGETFASCPSECLCGNRSCEASENYSSCPVDCHCGNGSCEVGESATACAEDCS